MKKISVMKNPDITLYPAIKVTKDTILNFENENVKQELKNLIFHSITIVKGDTYTSKYDTTINLNEGDILVFEAEERGYIKPLEKLVSVQEVIDDLECIKGI